MTKIRIVLMMIFLSMLISCSKKQVVLKTKIDRYHFTVIREHMPLTVDDNLFLFVSTNNYYDLDIINQTKFIEAEIADSMSVIKLDNDSFRVYLYVYGHMWVEPKESLKMSLEEYEKSLPLIPVDSIDLNLRTNPKTIKWNFEDTWEKRKKI